MDETDFHTYTTEDDALELKRRIRATIEFWGCWAKGVKDAVKTLDKGFCSEEKRLGLKLKKFASLQRDFRTRVCKVRSSLRVCAEEGVAPGASSKKLDRESVLRSAMKDYDVLRQRYSAQLVQLGCEIDKQRPHFSKMFLESWHSLDKAATEAFLLLRDVDEEISHDVNADFSPLFKLYEDLVSHGMAPVPPDVSVVPRELHLVRKVTLESTIAREFSANTPSPMRSCSDTKTSPLQQLDSEVIQTPHSTPQSSRQDMASIPPPSHLDHPLTTPPPHVHHEGLHPPKQSSTPEGLGTTYNTPPSRDGRGSSISSASSLPEITVDGCTAAGAALNTADRDHDEAVPVSLTDAYHRHSRTGSDSSPAGPHLFSPFQSHSALPEAATSSSTSAAMSGVVRGSLLPPAATNVLNFMRRRRTSAPSSHGGDSDSRRFSWSLGFNSSFSDDGGDAATAVSLEHAQCEIAQLRHALEVEQQRRLELECALNDALSRKEPATPSSRPSMPTPSASPLVTRASRVDQATTGSISIVGASELGLISGGPPPPESPTHQDPESSMVSFSSVRKASSPSNTTDDSPADLLSSSIMTSSAIFLDAEDQDPSTTDAP
eukprot:Rmarinus@m.25841